MRNKSLDAKLVMLITSIAFFVVLVTLVLDMVFETASIRKQLMDSYQTTINMQASNLEAAVMFREPFDAQDILDTLTLHQSFQWAAVYMQDGTMLASYQIDDGDGRDGSGHTIALDPETETHFAWHTFSINQPIVVKNKQIGWVLAYGESKEYLNFLKVKGILLVFMLIFSLFIAMIMASCMGKVIIQPILNLAATAEKIRDQQDFSVRQTKCSDDEIGGLVESFNEMMDQIEAQNDVILEAKEKAEASNKAKDEFLSVMSHELRTPLNPIIGYTELIKAETENLDVLQFAQSINSAGNHLLSIINSILDYTRIEKGIVNLDFAPIDIECLCSEIMDLVKRQFSAKPIALTVEHFVNGRHLDQGNQPHPAVLLDRMRVSQLLLNILENACKFTQQGDVSLATYLDVYSPEKAKLRIRVIDSGPGIAPEHIERVFEPFRQIDSSMTRQHGGIGLGLAICFKIIQLFDGDIKCESEFGKGCCFEFSFDVSLGDSSNDLNLPERSHSGVKSSKNGKILLVEDDRVNQELTTIQLKKLGFEVDLAVNGLEGVKMAGQNDYNVILMDLQLPEMDGMDATKRIREQEEKGHRTPIIAVTAHAAIITKEDCIRHGMNDYLSKPFKMKQLSNILSAFQRK